MGKDAFGGFPQAQVPPDTVPPSNVVLPYPFQDNSFYIPEGSSDSSLLYLRNPRNLEEEVEYDPETNQYIFRKKWEILITGIQLT